MNEMSFEEMDKQFELAYEKLQEQIKTAKKEFKERMEGANMNNHLPSMEDYKTILNIQNLNNEWSEPIFRCPKCEDGGMCKNNRYVLTSLPPKHKYRCDKCGHEEVL